MQEKNDGEVQPLSREEWLERVMQEGRDEVIRREMIRMGFWSEEPLPPEELEKQAQEEKELAQLKKELESLEEKTRKLGDLEAMIRKRRQERIEESKRRRAQRKEERARRRAEAQARWKEYRKQHVIHVGEGFSGDLERLDSDAEKLRESGLPLIHTPQELAEAMEIPLGRLKWLTYHRDTATISHYHHFTIPKKSGGKRILSAPKKHLRQAQEWIRAHLLDRVEVHPCAYGFVRGKSIVDNAAHHVGKAAVIKMDLKDFFPSVHYPRVKGMYQSLGYSPAVSTLLALLCTEPPRRKVEFDDRIYHVALGDRHLPQGAPTSPAITNLLCRRLDERLLGLADSHGFAYTRYADDLTFSCWPSGVKRIGALLGTARGIVRYEGFEVNEEKTRVLRSSRRQAVTGIIVNEKPNLNRGELRAFRALLHQVEQKGLEGQNIHNHPNFWEYIKGYTSYIGMVRGEAAAPYREQVKRIARKYGLDPKVVSDHP